MMRYYRLRFDIWICLAIGFIISFGTGKITENMVSKKYESYVKEHTVESGKVGGIANETIFRAQNIEDLLSHETFTIISPGIEYRNKGAGYYKNKYMQAVTLPSGERVAALINEESVQHSKESIYNGDSILPVGKVVYEDLTKDTYFINQIEYKESLSRTDFYIDMIGNGGKLTQEDYIKRPSLMVQIATIVLCFIFFHTIGSKIGIFPSFFSFKKTKQSEWK